MVMSGMVQNLNTQMNLEFSASNLYLHLSDWCSENKLIGAANFLRAQAQINVTHVIKLFDYIKKSGDHPIVSGTQFGDEPCSTLEDLFQKILGEHLKLSATLVEFTRVAKSLNDDSTAHFLFIMKKEHQQNGLLLQNLLDEVRISHKAGLCMQQTDRRLMNMVNKQLH
ncbi:non-heme ferritin-like protein [Buttiauxella sp. WJP83]|uniref:non-heme ferritin-like protein n=1 Tax=Buttiauxella sp. WJP83 TaxID=2986951 RepID=UPI0022DD9458|nr:non-heme ferritin-like protein [Buttiauxella sp. WJP83]WBM69665.1 non-heme ferritin-like protein [Buttiauxella sp. WJP83]